MSSPNKKKIWGCVLASPTSNNSNPGFASRLIGKWIGNSLGVNCGAIDTPSLLFFTRKEAEAFAKKCGEENNCWVYAAKKYRGKGK